jgi:hypothetical protein
MQERLRLYLVRRIQEMKAQGANTERIVEQLGAVADSRRELRKLIDEVFKWNGP